MEGIKSLADGGVGAVVMYSLFEEQLRREAETVAALEDLYDDSFAEALEATSPPCRSRRRTRATPA